MGLNGETKDGGRGQKKLDTKIQEGKQIYKYGEISPEACRIAIGEYPSNEFRIFASYIFLYNILTFHVSAALILAREAK
jgi:hypothetical protein